MFRKKGKSISPKQRMLKVFRLIRDLGKEDPNVCLPMAVPTVAPYELTNSLRQHTLDVELKKAKALAHWHREKMRGR